MTLIISYEICDTGLCVHIDHHHSFFVAAHVSVLSGLEQPFYYFFFSISIIKLGFCPRSCYICLVSTARPHRWCPGWSRATAGHPVISPRAQTWVFDLTTGVSEESFPKPRCWCQRTGVTEQRRLWLPLGPTVSTRRSLVLLLYDPYIMFPHHHITGGLLLWCHYK